MISDASENNLFDELNNVNQAEFSPQDQFILRNNALNRQQSSSIVKFNQSDMQPTVKERELNNNFTTTMFSASAIRPQIQMPPNPVLIHSDPGQFQQQNEYV